MQTIDSLIGESCLKFGDKVALRHKVAGAWQEISYEMLWLQAGRIANWLLREGFQPGNHAALLAPSSPGWVAAYLGILRAGGVVVPIDKELKRAELRHILIDSEAHAIFSEGVWLEMVQEMAPGYLIAGRLLRAAMVAVSKGGPSRSEARDEEAAPEASNEN